MRRSVTVKGTLKDLAAFKNLLPDRKERMKKASAKPKVQDPINALARRLHPGRLYLVIEDIRDETKSMKTFRFVPDPDSETKELPVFRAGQYLSFKVDVGGTRITRPYSISSSPGEAVRDGFLEITVRKVEDGFLTGHIWKNWEIGTKVATSGPCGFFYHEPLRDTKEIVGLAGGCGFTPFRSMIKDIFENELDVKLTLLFGIRTPDEIIFEKELREFEKQSPEKFKVIYVCSEPGDTWTGPSGFLTAELIEKHTGGSEGKTFFICGPPAMYKFIEQELEPFNIPPKRIRREVFGEIPDVTEFPGFPKEKAGETYEIKVQIGSDEIKIPGKATETVLVAVERAKLAPPSRCRSGECGFCDSILMSGDIFVSPENDGRRQAGIKFSHFHPCSSYPVSDLEVKVMRDS